MSTALADALQNVDLEVGRTYRCEVQGYLVELRVFDRAAKPEAPPVPESDIMLDAWTELPSPTGGVRVQARPGTLPPLTYLRFPRMRRPPHDVWMPRGCGVCRSGRHH